VEDAVTPSEKVLLKVLGYLRDRNTKAVMVQSFIAENGPLSEEAAELVRQQLRKGQWQS
jgi:hypothetical protein